MTTKETWTSRLSRYRHVCAFFSSAEDEYNTLLPFVLDGLKRGERAYHVLPPQYLEEHLGRLLSVGIDVARAQQRRQLELATPQETYLSGGRFNRAAMLGLIQEVLKVGVTLGFPRTRLIAHAETVLEDWPSVSEWVEYEAQLNDVLTGYDDSVICTYDANLLNGAILIDVLRTHPATIIGGLLYENPVFVPPQEFLRRHHPSKPYRA